MIARTSGDYEGLRKSGRILAAVLDVVEKQVVPGVATKELNRLAEETVSSLGGRPAFLGYNGFPAGLCVSVNEEVVHGVPGNRILKKGDVVSIDFGVEHNGYFTDAARTIVAGSAQEAWIERMIETTQRALNAGVAAAIPSATTGDVGYAIQNVVEENGFGLVRELVGHGVGGGVHEDPSVPNYGNPGEGATLEKGMVLAIEPMVTAGGTAVERGVNGQVYQMVDRSLAAHFEHTVIVGNPPEIVTGE